MGLDRDQAAVVADYNGARCVIAGPGAGKTTTMVALIRTLLDGGVFSSEIRAVTFSKEMAAALEKKLGIKGIVSTFHSLGYSICSEVERKPVEPELRHRLMMKLIRRYNLDYKELDNFIAFMRRENLSPEEVIDTSYDWGLCQAYAQYEATRLLEGWIDFDSMLRDAVNLLEKKGQTWLNWQIKYLIVDEAQDTDNCQWRMMQLMAEMHGNITVVGDPNQAIYGFRGAKPQNLTQFEKWFPGGRKLYLGRNYRSTQNIVKFVRENAPSDAPQELLDKMVAARQEPGLLVDLKMYWNDKDEAESALAQAARDPLHSIILARTNRMVGELERLCNRYSIRYHLLGRTGYWKQNEVHKAIEALKKYDGGVTKSAMAHVLPTLQRKYLVDDRTDRDNDALENLNTLAAIANDFPILKDFLVYANKMMHRRNDPRGVTISTVHQAKGGEWERVFIIGASGKGFPHPKGDPLEEQRLWHVAVSRPIDYMRISFSAVPSPFLRKYLPEPVLDKMREQAAEVDRIQGQARLF